MRIDVRSRRIPISPTIQALLRRRTRSALQAFEAGVQSVLLNVEPEVDVDGTEQRRCFLSLRADWGRIDIDASGPDIFSAVQATLGKLNSRLVRLCSRAA